MGFQQMLLAWKSTLVHDSQPIGDVVPKDLHPIEKAEDTQETVLDHLTEGSNNGCLNE